MEPARCESCPSGHRRGLAAPGDDKVASPVWKSPIHMQFQTSGDENSELHGRYRLPGLCGNPLIDDWLGPMEPARCESCPSGYCRGLAAPGKDKVISPVSKNPMLKKLRQPEDKTSYLCLPVRTLSYPREPSFHIVYKPKYPIILSRSCTTQISGQSAGSISPRAVKKNRAPSTDC